MTLAAILTAVFVASVVGTGLMRRFAVSRRILDVPVGRSSHTIVTPRGGGVAFALSYLAGQTALLVTDRLDASVAVALTGAGVIVAVVGFVDDCRPVAAPRRLLSHVVAAVWILYWMGGPMDIELFGVHWHPGAIGVLLTAISLVWLLNLYNFMDGIDGIAGVEALTACAGAVVVGIVGHARTEDLLLPATLSLAVGGFLVWNFPPAKIFMGDAGSGFLGITLGAIALHASHASPRWLWCWVILLGVFITDATATLCRRFVRGERVFEAHRSHAYQHAAHAAGRHAPVTLAVGLINLFWLLPWAVAAGNGFVHGSIAMVLAYAPLLAMARYWRAGVSTPSPSDASSTP